MPAVRPATAADRTAMADTLIAAFMDDPVLSWAMPDARLRRRYGRRFFDFMAWRLVGDGESWVADGAAAIWAAPDHWRETPLELARLGFLTWPGVFGRTLRTGWGLSGIEAKHPREPHLYLADVGVHPEKQGQGLGTAIIEPGVARADALALPAYLESSNPRNVPLYERFGFAVTETVTLPKGPVVTLMWRPAPA